MEKKREKKKTKKEKNLLSYATSLDSQFVKIEMRTKNSEMRTRTVK